jgi:hypothetical protein
MFIYVKGGGGGIHGLNYITAHEFMLLKECLKLNVITTQQTKQEPRYGDS